MVEDYLLKLLGSHKMVSMGSRPWETMNLVELVTVGFFWGGGSQFTSPQIKWILNPLRRGCLGLQQEVLP